jgi:hypothetical protein
MKFWFCEKCGKRVTDGDLEQGNARDKKARGMYCSDCAPGVMTVELPAIQDPVDAPPARRESALKVPVAKPASQPSMDAARPAHTPAKKHARAESEANNTLLIGGAVAGVVVLGLALVVLGGGSNSPRPAPSPKAAVDTPAPLSPSPAPAPFPAPASPKTTVAPPSGGSTSTDPAEKAFAQLTQDVNALPQNDIAGRTALVVDFVEKHGESNAGARAQMLLRDLREQASVTMARTPAPQPETPAPAAQTPSPAPTPAAAPQPPVATPAPIPTTPKTPATSKTAEAEFAYRVYVLELGNAVRSRRTDLAKFIQKMQDDPLLAAHKDEIAADQKIVQWLANLDALLPKGAQRLKDIDLLELKLSVGAPVKVGKRADLQLNSLDGDTMNLSGRGMNLSLALDKLTFESRTELIALACDPRADGGLSRAVLACLAATGSADAEPEKWVDAARKGAAAEDVAVVERLLKAIKSSVFEEAALKAIDALEKTFATSNWKRLYDEYSRFSGDYGKSVTAQRAADRLEKLAAHITMKLTPVADTYVQDGEPKRNYGAEKILLVKNDPPIHTRVAYILFDLSKYKGTIGSARVKLRTVYVGLKGTRLSASIAASDWEESTLLWAGRPAPSAAIANWKVVEKDEDWIFDVTEAARAVSAGTKKLTICIASVASQSSYAMTKFASREDAERAPTLTISALAEPAR